MRKETQGEKLERVRDELSLSKVDFCALLGVSRPWYDKWLKGQSIDLESLCLWAADHTDEPVGKMAIELLMDNGFERFIPCNCETEIGDAGPCPKHTPLPSASPQIPLRGYLEGKKIAEVAA